MFTLERTDIDVLENPRAAIIAPGGTILFVEAAARGLKAGEFLLAAMIDRARALQAKQLYLLTNRDCAAAIHLYEKAGFHHDAEIMAQYGARYARCDVAMDYPL